MSFFRKLLGGGDDDAAGPVRLDVEARTAQVLRLEKALDQLIAVMADHEEQMANPGWRGRVGEYRQLSGEARLLRARSFTREELLDLCFEVRPVFTGGVPAGFEAIVPLQEELMDAARAMQEVLPTERG